MSLSSQTIALKEWLLQADVIHEKTQRHRWHPMQAKEKTITVCGVLLAPAIISPLR